MWRFLIGVKPPPQKKAKLSETDARYEKEKRRQKMDVFLSSALKCVGFSNGQPRIHQGNQIHEFGCPAFKIGTSWIFFKFRALLSCTFKNRERLEHDI